jgi:hypothetical protein
MGVQPGLAPFSCLCPAAVFKTAHPGSQWSTHTSLPFLGYTIVRIHYCQNPRLGSTIFKTACGCPKSGRLLPSPASILSSHILSVSPPPAFPPSLWGCVRGRSGGGGSEPGERWHEEHELLSLAVEPAANKYVSSLALKEAVCRYLEHLCTPSRQGPVTRPPIPARASRAHTHPFASLCRPLLPFVSLGQRHARLWWRDYAICSDMLGDMLLGQSSFWLSLGVC